MKKLQPIFQGRETPGIYRFSSQAKPASVLSSLDTNGWRGFYLNGEEVVDKKSFLLAAGDAMDFPSYQGQNWDALEDSIHDLDWAPTQSGYVLLYDDVSTFASSSYGDWQTAQSIFREAIRSWGNTATPMYILLRQTNRYARQYPKL